MRRTTGKKRGPKKISEPREGTSSKEIVNFVDKLSKKGKYMKLTEMAEALGYEESLVRYAIYKYRKDKWTLLKKRRRVMAVWDSDVNEMCQNLYKAVCANGMTFMQLAEFSGVKTPELYRWINGGTLSFNSFVKVTKAVGMQLNVHKKFEGVPLGEGDEYKIKPIKAPKRYSEDDFGEDSDIGEED